MRGCVYTIKTPFISVYNCKLQTPKALGNYREEVNTKMMTDEEIIQKLEETTMKAEQLQRETLGTILQRNAGVRYLQPYLQGRDVPIDEATFRRAVPLSSYDDYANYIGRLADGVLNDDDGTPLLSFDPLLLFFYSSGSSSMQPKLIPYFDSIPGKAVSSMAHQSGAAIFRRLFPPRTSANKVLWFLYAGNVTATKGGYKAMAATSYALHTDTRNSSRFLSMLVSPKEVVLGSDVHQQMYCHLLCGLRQWDSVDGIRAPYAAGLINAFSLLEAKWEQLCKDLENGFPSSEIITDPSIRESVIQILSGPEIDLSIRIKSICQEKSWEGIIGKLWPNARYVKTVSSGSMQQYYSKLKFYAGDMPILGGDYFASECSVAMNFDITQPPERTRYVILPNAAYFEFLPFDLNESSIALQETVELSGVELGKMYEVVVTTFRGLFRYRLGDIVKVVGFYNSSPEVEFVMRAPKSSLDIITERDLLSSMEGFLIAIKDATDTEIVEFASFLEQKKEPKQLKVFIEIKEGSALMQNEKLQESLGDLRKYCALIEQGFGGIYGVMKVRGELGPLLLFIVKPGSFDSLLRVASEIGSSASQYKPPKIIRSHKIAELLESCAIVTVQA